MGPAEKLTSGWRSPARGAGGPGPELSSTVAGYALRQRKQGLLSVTLLMQKVCKSLKSWRNDSLTVLFHEKPPRFKRETWREKKTDQML